MKGLAHTAELPLAPNQAAKDAYQVGQVVKCRVLSTDFSHQRLKLSLMGKKSGAEGAAGGAEAGDPLRGLQPGDIVEGSVREVENTEVCPEIEPPAYQALKVALCHTSQPLSHGQKTQNAFCF